MKYKLSLTCNHQLCPVQEKIVDIDTDGLTDVEINSALCGEQQKFIAETIASWWEPAKERRRG